MRQLIDDFIADLEATAAAYLTHSDPIRQSGFGGGEVRWNANTTRWRQERCRRSRLSAADRASRRLSATERQADRTLGERSRSIEPQDEERGIAAAVKRKVSGPKRPPRCLNTPGSLAW